MRTSTWESIFALVHSLWVIACYVMTAVCVYKGDYAQATFWLAWLILDRVSTKEK